ncbi:SDR family NAD(P)-dependent oxidoreductase [Nocardia brasiliensis]|uniref:Short-chain dehydrogenase/reductase family protein n=1 Tax=Nocardia brasiliensis (strain ATCC 700358 / HUJEG-1) TaxID=1133849 RepID=K0EWL9_NOCB7|nr:short-chain dehydrogenase/reductase family protein [Nocardia brasiliensis ATCC 700358]OCF85901.1 acetoin dehydrogenase [Nocardia brasiliensis]
MASVNPRTSGTRWLQGKVAVVTGAGSGIGAATAVALARSGAGLALADIDETGMKETAGRIAELGGEVSTHLVDVGSRDTIYAFAAAVEQRWGRADIVVNNAGVAVLGDGVTVSDESLRWIVDINFWGVVHGTRAFHPLVERSGGGTIVNVSSVFGLLGMPCQSAYSATKFAVRGFSESVRMELRLAGSPVRVLTVHPGGIRTNIARSTRFDGTGIARADTPEANVATFDRLARLTPEQTAAAIVKGIRGNKAKIRIGTDAIVMDIVQRLFPVGYQRIMLTVLRLGLPRTSRSS